MKRSPLSSPLVCGLLASFCCLLWGSAIPFINLGYRLFAIASGDTASQLLFAGCRFVLAGLLAVAMGSVGRRRLLLPQRESLPNVVRLALAQTVAQYVCFYIGVAHTTSVEGSIIQGLNGFVSILVACYVFRFEAMNGKKWLGGLLGVAGVVLVNLGGGRLSGAMHWQGEGMLMLSMIANACSAALLRAYGQTDDPVALSGWQFVLGGGALAVCGLLMGGSLAPEGPLAACVLLYLAFLSAAAYSIWGLLLRVNPVSRVTAYTFLQPIFGVLLSLLLVRDDGGAPLTSCALALALVSAGIFLVGRGQKEDA